MCVNLSHCVYAQKTVKVHGEYSYEVGENDNITFREAKRKCLELAKAEAIKAEFGELITSDVIDSNVETNGEATSSFFWENTVAMAKGDWLGDTQPAEFTVEYVDNKLIFKAEVWGMAREIIQSKADLRWKILKDVDGEMEETNRFFDRELVYLSFRSPADGYLAVYLITGDDETSCLLPYRKDPTGRFQVKRGKEYIFFNREKDPETVQYRLSTKHPMEDNQFVVIFSPNPFTKCNDITGDAKHPNSLSTFDFQKWLLRAQRADSDMIVDKSWVKIRKRSSQQE
jgi:hypothetical protein